MSQPEKYRSGNQSEENRNRFKILIGTQKTSTEKNGFLPFPALCLCVKSTLSVLNLKCQ